MAMALGIISCAGGGGGIMMMMKKEVVGGGLFLECSSRPQKKATTHHMKTRPKKTEPWDVMRKGPTPYPPLPALPPDWTLLESAPQQQGTNYDEQLEVEVKEEEVLVSAAAAAGPPP